MSGRTTPHLGLSPQRGEGSPLWPQEIRWRFHLHSRIWGGGTRKGRRASTAPNPGGQFCGGTPGRWHSPQQNMTALRSECRLVQSSPQAFDIARNWIGSVFTNLLKKGAGLFGGDAFRSRWQLWHWRSFFVCGSQRLREVRVRSPIKNGWARGQGQSIRVHHQDWLRKCSGDFGDGIPQPLVDVGCDTIASDD